MVDRPDRTCVPIEVEMLPLYREPGSARLRRELKREQRRERRAKRAASGRRRFSRPTTFR
jgi:hypothetical protein